ncbi:hypothetical protein HHK36_017467 [Tetracentron sinense]|uniref:Dirigent protein n=1 Tax=Tetracentron sinense TaxID=13715 RepID=A0A835DF63_TETSI|nr:hypothetical protein HHK36_017467 [Tetracentron sinense]
MARILPKSGSPFVIFSVVFFFIAVAVAGKPNSFSRSLSQKKIGLKKEKLSHFRLYWHDIISGPNPTGVIVVGPPSNTSVTGFGLTRMIDNPLTMGPKMSSKLVGRAQGFYASAAQQELGLLMAMNFAFIEGKYNGSTITILGRNPVFSTVREMPVIGGSGLFRFARGYVQAKTHTLDLKTGDATVEYNVFVMHY